jgi:hypothetical protein
MSQIEPDSSPNVASGLERLWLKLASEDPEALCARSGVAFRDGRYVVPFLDRQYLVEVDSRRISGPRGDGLPDDQEFRLLILGYLTHAQGGRAAGTWVSERQLPGGSLFFQGPHALPLAPLVRHFGRDGEAFRKIGVRLGGQPLDFGDVGFAFQALPLVPLAVLLWIADEEFPARAGMLFDPTVPDHLPLDLVLALVHAAVARFEAAAPD